MSVENTLYVIIGICHCRRVLRRPGVFLHERKKTYNIYDTYWRLKKTEDLYGAINVFYRPPFGKSPPRSVATFSRFGRLIEELTFHHFHHRATREGKIEKKCCRSKWKTGFERSKIFSHLSKGIVIYLVLALTRELYEFRDFFPKSAATE